MASRAGRRRKVRTVEMSAARGRSERDVELKGRRGEEEGRREMV